MSETPAKNDTPNMREYYKVTPSTGSDTTVDIDAHLTSLTDLRKSLSEDEESSGILSSFTEGSSNDKVKFSFIPLSTGPGEPVELYYTADGKLETLGRRLHSIYPESFDIEKVHLDIGKKLIRPVRMSKEDFIARLFAGQLHVTPEEISEDLEWGGELDGETEEDRQATAVKPLDLSETPPLEDHTYGEDLDPAVKAVARGAVDTIGPTSDAYQGDSTADGGTTSEQGSESATTDTTNPFDPHRLNPSALDDNGERDESTDGPGLFGDRSGDNAHSETGDEDEEEFPEQDENIPIQVDNDEVSGTILVDPPSQAAAHIIETEHDKNQVADVALAGPTLSPDGNDIFARPAAEYTIPKATRWYGQEETIKDWMTTLKTATESNPEYESETNEEDDAGSPETVENLFEHLENAEVPTAFQVVFQARRDWSEEAQERKQDIRSGDFNEPWLEKYVLGGYETDEDRDLKAFEYRRIKLIENKRPKKTFNANVRAVSFVPQEEFTPDPDTPTPLENGSIAAAEEALGSLKPVFDPLDGIYYHVIGETAPQSPPDGTDLSAPEVAENFINHDLVTREDRRYWHTRFNLWNDPKKRPELILNADELSDFVIIPSGEEMDGDAFRSTGTTDADADHFRRPRPEIHKQLTGGMDIGYAFDEDGIPEDEPTSVPENVLTHHWLKVGASGSGKTINTIGMLLSLHENVAGPTILVDPKSGDMVENYAKSHAATFDELRSVQVFDVPEVLPAIPFFDIRPYLHEGMNRDDAIQQKVDEFHLVMEMVDENYGNAYVAKTVLGAIIKSEFDARHGADSYTLDDLYSTAVEMYAEQTIPRVSHQPQVERILTNQLNNTEQDFKNTMQAVINRLDDLQEDINLYRLFNQNPDWDDKTGSYKWNGMTKEDYEEKKENGKDPDPPRSALDFRELLDTNKVILFDTGDFVRDESQQAFSMYILSALWGAVRSRYNDRKSHEDIDNTVNLVIEEAAPIVSTELVTNTLIPEAREFGLSLGMVMQFPEQVRKHSDSDTYNELITNVQSKLIGQLEPDNRLVDSLVHGDKDRQEIKNKIRQLSGGEWIADLPAPQFGADVPPPFSIKSLGIPEGHPEGDEAFDASERDIFYRRYSTRKQHVANRHGYERPSAEEIAQQQSPGDSVGYHGEEEDDETDTGESPTTPGVPETDSGDDTAERTEKATPGLMGSAGDDNSSGGVSLGSATDDESNGGNDPSATPDQAEESDTAVADDGQSPATEAGGETASADPDSDSPNFGAYAPLPPGDVEEVCGEVVVDGEGDLATIAFELLTSLPEEEYYRSMLTLSQIAAMEGIEMEPVELHRSAQAQVSSDAADADTMEQVGAPTGEATPHASDVDGSDSSDGDIADDAGTTTPDAGTVGAEASDESATDDATDSDDGGSTVSLPQRIGDVDSSDIPDSDSTLPESISQNMFHGNEPDGDETDEDEQQATGSEDSSTLGIVEAAEGDQTRIDLTDTDDQPAEDDPDEEQAEDLTLDTPLPPAHADFNLDRYDDHEFSEDDKEFLSLIADAFRNELDWYTLTDSMTSVRDHAGDPDVDSLFDCGYIDDGKIGNRKYYSLTRKGWRVVSDSVPGNEFGDHMEKMPHRVGVHLLTEHIAERDDVAWSEQYARYEGETYDVIGYDAIGSVVVTGEVETESNNPTAVAEDYEKLAEAPGDVIWAHPSERAFSSVWKMINEHALDNPLPKRAIERTHRLEEYTNDHDLPGADVARTYSKLNQEGE